MASDFSIRHAALLVKNGGIIAYPTDTIYGLGCDPYNVQAVEQLNNIKQRASNKQFILLAGNIDQLKPIIKLDYKQEKKILAPSTPTSWVVESDQHIPPWLTDRDHNISIRISSHPLVQKLCHSLGQCIISTSANPAGKTPARNSIDLHRYFHARVDKILISDKPLAGKPSKVIRLCDNHIFRQ